MMKLSLLIFTVVILHECVCPPVNPKKKPDEDPFADKVEYSRYLNEILKELEGDESFRKRVEELQQQNKSIDYIATQLDFVHHSVRTRLDEVKRREVDRLNKLERELERRKKIKSGGGAGLREPPVLNDADIIQMGKDHLDHDNPHSFEVADLEKLIKKVMTDIKGVDEKQEEEFKNYEMEKEHKKRMKLKHIKDEKERKEAEKAYEESQKRHKDHKKIHHPGSEEQLKDVWEKEDHMDRDNFDPTTLFHMHDVNNDGHLDVNELESMMQKELGKVYNPNDTDDDMVEKYHEAARMRKEFMNEVDTNKDNMLSLPEILAWTKSKQYKEDEAWKTQEEEDKPVYSDDEFKHFEEDYGREHPEEHDSEDDDNLRFESKDGKKPEDHHGQAEQHPPANQQHPVQGQEHPPVNQQHPVQGQEHPPANEQHPPQGQEHPAAPAGGH